jgi:hypothetical protein
MDKKYYQSHNRRRRWARRQPAIDRVMSFCHSCGDTRKKVFLLTTKNVYDMPPKQILLLQSACLDCILREENLKGVQ